MKVTAAGQVTLLFKLISVLFLLGALLFSR